MVQEAITGGTQKRYEQLRESVRVLRAQLRSSSGHHHHVPSSSSSWKSDPKVAGTSAFPDSSSSSATEHLRSSNMLSSTASCSLPTTPRLIAAGGQESFSMQHLRLQYHIELQEKREEIKKLLANQRGKSQQIENLENEHRNQRRKLEARIEHHSDKICALEAQLSHRIALNQQELQAQAYAFAARLRQCEDEKCQQLDALRVHYETAIASNEEHHRFELSQARMAEAASAQRANEAEATVRALADKMKELELELAGLKKHMTLTQQLIKKKEEECNLKMNELKPLHEAQLQELRTRSAAEKDAHEREKEDLTKRHVLELQSYKMQKVREMDCVAERVRAAVESKDLSIALLKGELAKQHEQASALLDIS